MASAEVEFSILAGSGVPTRSFKQSEIIFHEGDPASVLYVIKSGQVDVTSGNRLLAKLSENDIFGEMALIDKEPRSATVTAATDVEIVAVDERQFLFLVSQTPFFALKVMRSLVHRLRVANKGI